MGKPLIALIGRPNVGKSTIFNRLVKSRQALVDDMPGVTRDRHYKDAQWEDNIFTVIDTGGYLTSDDDDFASQIKKQLFIAMDQADVLVFVLDGREGLSPYDRDLAQLIRKTHKPVFYLINKIENRNQHMELGEFYTIGIDKFYPISAEHGLGIADFLDDLVKEFHPSKKMEPSQTNPPIKVAIVGRPNVGKSCLTNQLFGEQRVVVNKKAGTTRDAIELSVEHKGQSFVLVDTAGIRRKGKVKEKLEKFSILKSLKSLDDCDVALLLIDSTEGITDQDITIAGYAAKRGCGTIFLFNKWDAVDKNEISEKQMKKELSYAAKFLSFAPVLTISALTGQRCHKIFDIVMSVHKEYISRINTGAVNRIIEDAVFRQEPSLHKGKRLRFFYATQAATRPPSFVCFVNYPKAVHFSYQRYLINQLRERIPLELTPIRLFFREKTGKIDFSHNTKEKERIETKKAKTIAKRKQQRKEQSRKKRERNQGNI